MNPPDFSSSYGEQQSAGPGRGSSPLDWARRAGMADDVLQEVEALGRARRQRRKTALAWMGAVAALLIAGTAVTSRISRHPSATATMRMLTPTEKTLADGTVVQLKSGAEIAVDFTPSLRRVTLQQGTAHFHVAKNPLRPFVVTARGVTVRAVGTQFSVDVGPQSVDVLVDEGRVAVAPISPFQQANPAKSPAPDSALVSAGQQVVVTQDQLREAEPTPEFTVTSLAPNAVKAKMAWRTPRFDFSGAALDQVVAAFNRHNGSKLVLADPGLAELHISGTLRVDNISGLLQMLAQSFRVRAVQQGDEIILSREPAPAGA